MEVYDQTMPLNDITIGGFLPGNSILHRLDPRTKLVGLVVLMPLFFIGSSGRGCVLSAAASICLAALTRLGWTVWAWGLKRFVLMFALVGGLNLFFTGSGPSLEILGIRLPFTFQGFITSLILVVQLAGAIVISMVLTFTTTAADLTRGLQRLASPLKRLNVHVDEYAMVALMAMRFVPMLQQEVRTTIEAQKARGVEFGDGALYSRARNLVAVLSPSFMGALQRADLLATTMYSRGFRPGEPRSCFHPMNFSVIDYAAAAIVALFVLLRLTLFS